MKIAITTPTGRIGGHLVDILATQGRAQQVLLARHPAKLILPRRRGAIVIEGDLYDEDYVRRATRGAEALFWVEPMDIHTQDMCHDYRRLAENAAAAIDDNGIPRVVHISSIGAHRSRRMGPILALREAEIILDQSNASITHLRTGPFMENFLWSIDNINTYGAIMLPISGSVRVPMIATRDIAREAARALSDESWYGRRTLEVIGPADVSFAEAAADIGEALGRDVRYEMIAMSAAREMLHDMGFSRHCAAMLLDLHAGVNNGLYGLQRPRNEAIVTPTSFPQFARSVMVAAIHAREPAVPT